ncbi:MAG TPA: energy-coupling factor transporter transmembrane component T [Longilinea sp.]|nr:energy-coupling factor transporter transmembrane component T [Longilinea sp.]
MNDRLSFYVDRPSPLHRLNPLTKLAGAFAFIIIAFSAHWYWAPLVIFIAGVIPVAIAGRLGREFFGTSVRLFLPLFAFLFVMQSLFYPGGQTVLFHVWVLSVKVESVQFAFLTAMRILVMVSSFMLVLLSTHPSTLMSDLTQRGLPAMLSYIITSTLQIIPQMRSKAGTIIDAQRSRGLNTEGSLGQRVKALLPLVGPLVFGSLVDVEERAVALEARAFNAPRKKTSLRAIPDTNWERVLRWIFALLMVVSIGSNIWLS